MLSDFTPSATISVKNLKAVRSFYEGILGFKPIGSTLRGAQAFKVAAEKMLRTLAVGGVAFTRES